MAEKDVTEEASGVPSGPQTPFSSPKVFNQEVEASVGGDVLIKYVRGGSYSIEGYRFTDDNPLSLVPSSLANALLSSGNFVRASESERQGYKRNKK